MKRTLLLLALTLPLFAKPHVPTANTKAAIKQYVLDAAAFVAKNGADCSVLLGPDWRAGDFYVFVDEGGKSFCHPDPKMAGKANVDIIDVNGKKVGLALEAAAKRKGGGWVDYVWARPGTDKPVAKSAYVTSVKAPNGKTYIIGAGGYELK
jgi:cytochrome c